MSEPVHEPEDGTPVVPRPSVAAMDEIIGRPFPVLDKGFLRVVDYMGDDAAIVQAARVSYGKGTKQVSQDRGLIRYLLRHRHTTPFEMCEIKLHLKMPIFVARQWVRHRTANINEYSARYSVLADEFFTPAPGELAEQSAANAQGRGAALEAGAATAFAALMEEAARGDYALYQRLLGGEGEGAGEGEGSPGVARELARTVLPLSIYTEFYWKCDLHNYLHFVGLRADPHAQKEIRAYAEVMVAVLARWVPLAYEAWQDYAREAAAFSREEREVLARLLAGEAVAQSETKLSAREWRELGERLRLPPGETYRGRDAAPGGG